MWTFPFLPWLYFLFCGFFCFYHFLRLIQCQRYEKLFLFLFQHVLLLLFYSLRYRLRLSGMRGSLAGAEGRAVFGMWVGIQGLAYCITAWAKRDTKVLIKIVFSARLCYYKKVAVTHPTLSPNRHLPSPGGAALRNGCQDIHITSLKPCSLHMHIKVKISTGSTETTHSSAQLWAAIVNG